MELLLKILKFGHCSNLDSFMACMNLEAAEEVYDGNSSKTAFINEGVKFFKNIYSNCNSFVTCAIEL